MGKPIGTELIHNGKNYIVTSDKRIFAVQQKYDNGHCFGRRPLVTQKYILLDPEANRYKTITKKMEGTLKPSTAWSSNKRKEEQRKRNSKTVTVSA